VVAIGFMYPEGYIRQRIGADGWQVEADETVDRENAPISRVLDEKGNRLVVRVPVIESPFRWRFGGLGSGG